MYNHALLKGLDLNFTLLPGLLKMANWSTHAIGKWHVGWFNTSYLPTARGFDTFLGNSGNTGDYWKHTSEWKFCNNKTVRNFSDFIDCAGGQHNFAPKSVFGE